MKTPFRALLLEDVPKDAELLQEMLQQEGFSCAMDVVATKKDYINCLLLGGYDIIFADFTLPGFNGEQALKLALEYLPQIPFVCISGTIGEDRAVELLKQGASDYVLKDRMERFPFVTRRALELAEQQRALQKASQALQSQRILMETILNNAVDCIFIKDQDCRYLLVNEAAAKSMGLTPEEMTGKTDLDILPPDEALQTRTTDREVMEKGIPLSYEQRLTLSDGVPHFLDTIKCPMFDDAGVVNGLFGISRDITERKAMEQSLLREKERAEESDRLKSAFLHNISHEIRTPMNAIVGFSELLSDPALSSEKERYFCDVILKSSLQLLSIITDIIKIATIEAGQERVSEQSVHLNDQLRQLYHQFRLTAEKRNLDFRIASYLPDSEAVVMTDVTKLVQILNNLISNALKYTNQGSVLFGCRLNNDELHFYVEDTGVGIPAAMHQEIFKRFRQVENADTPRLGGSGLGLSISKAYVELLGGQIWVESEPDKGSIFHFTLPYKPAPAISQIEETHEAQLRTDTLRAITLLVADDEEHNFALITEQLSGLHVQIIRAMNGLEAVEICKSNPSIDLVFMDLKMPLMDGFEATRQIRQFCPSLPVVAVTAYSAEEDICKALACGCNDVIGKPFGRDQLISKMARQIS
ncbi:MAG: response regulator [Bacteroidales bacterium]